MSAVCDNCGQTVARYSQWPKEQPDGKYKFITSCYVCEHPQHAMASGAVRVFSELTLDHVTGEDGKPVRVTSLRQLREAEKRYGFRSVVANSDEKNFDNPNAIKRQMPNDAFEAMTANNKWMYPDIAKAQLADPQLQAELRRERGER